jgi:microcin C transport system permease protein
MPVRARFQLSPINRRRIAAFRRHRRGFWSLCAFLIVFTVSLSANLIANDRPLVASYKGEILFPVLRDYPDEKFGGFMFTPADYRSKDIATEIEAHGWMIWPPVHFSYATPNFASATPAPSPPTWALSKAECEAAGAARAQANGGANNGCRDIEANWLGTDEGDRDVLARVIYGTRVSIIFGLALTCVASLIGVTAGAIQGYFGGWIDLSFQRIIEIWSALPSLYVLIIISSFFTPSVLSLFFVLLLFEWVALVAVVRAEFLRARNFEYVRAARALGLTDSAIMLRHLLPNATVATLTMLPFIISGSITSLTALDFLGLGQPPGSASLGELLYEGRNHTEAPWLALSGFFTVGLILSLLVFIGEGVRDAFDPRKTMT